VMLCARVPRELRDELQWVVDEFGGSVQARVSEAVFDLVQEYKYADSFTEGEE